ncbi:MAG: LemA family protein [Candidatus Dormibacteria bacterium]
MITLIVIAAILLLVGVSVLVSYNRFVSMRYACDNAWANVDTELKRRYDLVPNLVASVRGYAAHERAVFEDVARARSAAQAARGPEASSAAQGPFMAALGKLFAVAENYPELKANENFLQLQAALADAENRIQASRATYNAHVQGFNRRVQAFPSALIASLFRFRNAAFFEIGQAQRAEIAAAPTVSFNRAPGAGVDTIASAAPSRAPDTAPRHQLPNTPGRSDTDA